jgi:creatinine amidohydrolase
MPVQSAADLVESLRLLGQRVRFVTWWKDRPKDVRGDRRRKPPTLPIPWGRPLR